MLPILILLCIGLIAYGVVQFYRGKGTSMTNGLAVVVGVLGMFMLGSSGSAMTDPKEAWRVSHIPGSYPLDGGRRKRR
jgi:uncharacterized membrane protein YuzA (DUF378 family)